MVERRVSSFMRFMLPYLNFVTYRFHVEKSREIGKCTLLSRVADTPLMVFLFDQIYLNLILYRNKN